MIGTRIDDGSVIEKAQLPAGWPASAERSARQLDVNVSRPLDTNQPFMDDTWLPNSIVPAGA